MTRILYLLLILAFVSCTKDVKVPVVSKPEGCDSIFFSYTRDIKPIFDFNCNFPACHAYGGHGSYDYTRYEVIADRIREGRLENRIDLPLDDHQHMPEGFALSPCDYFTLKTWIRQGYSNK